MDEFFHISDIHDLGIYLQIVVMIVVSITGLWKIGDYFHSWNQQLMMLELKLLQGLKENETTHHEIVLAVGDHTIKIAGQEVRIAVLEGKKKENE